MRQVNSEVHDVLVVATAERVVLPVSSLWDLQPRLQDPLFKVSADPFVNTKKPRLFWTQVKVINTDPSRPEAVALWYVTAEAIRSSDGSYEVTVKIHDSPIKRDRLYVRTLAKNHAAPATQMWYFYTGDTARGAAMSTLITRYDGYDFATVADAIWMMVEKCVETEVIIATGNASRNGDYAWKLNGRPLSEAPLGGTTYEIVRV